MPPSSTIAGTSIRDAKVRDRTGALVLALRDEDGTFTNNPAPETVIRAGQVIIAIGTPDDLDTLEELVGVHSTRASSDGGS